MTRSVSEDYPLLGSTEDYYNRQQGQWLRTQKKWRSAILAFAITVLTIAGGMIVVTSDGRVPLDRNVQVPSKSGPLGTIDASQMSTEQANGILDQIRIIEEQLKGDQESKAAKDDWLMGQISELLAIAKDERADSDSIKSKSVKLQGMLKKQQPQQPQQVLHAKHDGKKKKGGQQPQQPQQPFFTLKSAAPEADPPKKSEKATNVSEILESVGNFLDKIGSNLIPTKYFHETAGTSSSSALDRIVANVTAMFDKVTRIEEKLDEMEKDKNSFDRPLKMSSFEATPEQPSASLGQSVDNLDTVTKKLQAELNSSRHRFYSWLGRLADNMTVIFDKMQHTVSKMHDSVQQGYESSSSSKQKSPAKQLLPGGQGDSDLTYGDDNEADKKEDESKFDFSKYSPHGDEYKSFMSKRKSKASKAKESKDSDSKGKLKKPYYGLPPDSIMDAYMPKNVADSFKDKKAKKEKKETEKEDSVEIEEATVESGDNDSDGPAFVKDYGKFGEKVKDGFMSVNKEHMKQALKKNGRKKKSKKEAEETEMKLSKNE
ncbi:hypothetical protein HDE_10322 [Halotydeus destructor]|nr:hypothetical protein HDE_10322 [Halotydeus destructor]